MNRVELTQRWTERVATLTDEEFEALPDAVIRITYPEHNHVSDGRQSRMEKQTYLRPAKKAHDIPAAGDEPAKVVLARKVEAWADAETGEVRLHNLTEDELIRKTVRVVSIVGVGQ